MSMSTQIEHWKPINGYEGLYEVSDCGNIRSCVTTKTRREGVLKAEVKNGYLSVNLYKHKRAKHVYIHRIVAEHFLENKHGFNIINHIDCDKHNNHVSNLEWCTQKHNIQESIKNGLQRHHPTMLTEIATGKTINFYSKKEASRFLGKYDNFIQLYCKNDSLVYKEYLIQVCQ